MSEFKLVSPLLDGFIMGEPISSHDGVSCCPAIRENSEEKYIVKIISVPANQKQLDALLLTGAYPDPASATDYFKEVADEIAKDAALLQQLSRLEGFLPYEDWQIVPMEGSRLGYQIYLISPYKRSLEKYLRHHTMTHLGAVNLGLDLCAALSVCRRAGYLHLDLKPSNIFLTGSREYRIGDLGFSKLSSLKYTSLPSRYCSSYTPPELHDVLATLNPTVDIYAIGLILYQIYNNGVLPFDGVAPAAVLPAPMNADYEIAEIILKACDPNPRKRYQTPIEMGQALVSYMQRNNVSDDPIVPPAAEADYMDATYEPADEEIGSAATAPEETADAAAPAESVSSGDAAEEEVLSDESAQELSFLNELVSDETAPDTEDAPLLSDAALSDEVSSILTEADELLADSLTGEAPEESAAEEATPNHGAPEEPDNNALSLKDLLPQESAPIAEEVLPEEDLFIPDHTPKKRRWPGTLIWLLILALLAAGGCYYYQNYYLLPIDDIEISSVEDQIDVQLTTLVDEALLRVVCTDTYGNTLTSPVSGGKAQFDNLTPGTLYKIEVAAEGFHGLTGSYTGSATTSHQTKIIDFTGKTGTEDGSVVLSFTVEGPEQEWILEYAAEGEDTRTVSFTGHVVTVNNLTLGKTYTFKLVTEPGSNLFVVGTDTLDFIATQNVVAQNLQVISCIDGVLTAEWDTPAGIPVDGWTVRCYSENGYDQTQEVSASSAQFQNISTDASYTLEVTAAGMTQTARTFVSANPTTITEITVDDSVPGQLALKWNIGNAVPEGGWLVMYTMDSGNSDQVLKCTENTAVMEKIIPGTTYHISIQAADGSSVFGGSLTYTATAASAFQGYNVDAANISASLCPTPEKSNWDYEDIAADAYTSTYAPGSRVSMVIYSSDRPKSSGDKIDVLFVFRDSEGNILADLTSTISSTWSKLWLDRSRYCELDIPAIPGAPGQYTVQVYFNRALLVEKTLNIQE